jgi:acyl-coenzyme A synthetase/AMP-(fatty) acid ligase
MVRPGELPDSITLDRHALADGQIVEIPADLPEAIRLTGAGSPLPGVLLETARGGMPGPIKVRSASLARGYLAGATKSRKLVVDSKLRPDDLGFVRDGQLYPVSRTADVVIADGRRVLATEVEARLHEVAGVRRGSAVLLDVPWHDGAVVMAEPSRSVTHHRELAARLAQQCYVTAGIMPRESVIADRDALPKTPSGKVQRFRARELLSAYDHSLLARVECDERVPATGLRGA